MAINLICPACSTTIAAPDKAKGRRVKCPKCTTRFDANESRTAGGGGLQVWLLGGALAAIVLFCAVMVWLNN